MKNTEKSAKEITEVIHEALATGRLTPKEALSLRGRLAFAEGQLFGRGAQCALRVVGARGLCRSDSTYVDDSLSMALLWLCDRVLLAPYVGYLARSPGSGMCSQMVLASHRVPLWEVSSLIVMAGWSHTSERKCPKLLLRSGP